MPRNRCASPVCDRWATAHGLCAGHAKRQKKGQPIDTPLRAWAGSKMALTDYYDEPLGPVEPVFVPFYRCAQCDKFFTSDRKRPDGFRHFCSGSCRRRHARQTYYARYPEKKAEHQRNRAPARRADARRRQAVQRGAHTDGHTLADRLAVWDERGLYGCFYCGGPFEHVEHVTPIARGGSHNVGNLVPACAACNLSKSDTPVHEWLKGHCPEMAEAVDAAYARGGTDDTRE